MRKIEVYYITPDKCIKIHGACLVYNSLSQAGKILFYKQLLSGVMLAFGCSSLIASIGITAVQLVLNDDRKESENARN